MSSIASLRLSGAVRRPIVSHTQANVVSLERSRLPAAGLGRAIAPHAKVATYTSESDYNPQFISAAMNPSVRFNGQNIVHALTSTLATYDKGAFQPLKNNTFEVMSAKEGKDFIDGLSGWNSDVHEDDKANVKAWDSIVGLLRKNLTDLTVLKYGPRAVNGELATDQGLYAYMIVGKSIDGKVAGVMFGTVET